MGNAYRNAKCNLFPHFYQRMRQKIFFYNFYTVINVCVPTRG